MRIIPAIDLIEGKCVRLSKGDYATQKIYNEDPLEVAKSFEDAGLTYLHLVDLDGAKAGEIVNWRVLEKLAHHTQLAIDFGGGVKSNEAARIAFECGAKQITGGSVSVKDPELFKGWLLTYGSEAVILGADAYEEKIAVQGWQETTERYIYDFIAQYTEAGVKYVISTDIAKDGMLQGPSLEMYKKILATTPDIHLIASGGVSNLGDLEQLADLPLDGVIVGKAIYEGCISLSELSHMQNGS